MPHNLSRFVQSMYTFSLVNVMQECLNTHQVLTCATKIALFLLSLLFCCFGRSEDTKQGRGQGFSMGGRGTHLIVMSFSPPVVGGLLEKAHKRGVTGTPGPPLATPLPEKAFSVCLGAGTKKKNNEKIVQMLMHVAVIRTHHVNTIKNC